MGLDSTPFFSIPFHTTTNKHTTQPAVLADALFEGLDSTHRGQGPLTIHDMLAGMAVCLSGAEGEQLRMARLRLAFAVYDVQRCVSVYMFVYMCMCILCVRLKCVCVCVYVCIYVYVCVFVYVCKYHCMPPPLLPVCTSPPPTTTNSTGVLSRARVAAFLHDAYNEEEDEEEQEEGNYNSPPRSRAVEAALRRVFGEQEGGNSSVDWSAFVARVNGGGEEDGESQQARAVLLGWMRM